MLYIEDCFENGELNDQIKSGQFKDLSRFVEFPRPTFPPDAFTKLYSHWLLHQPRAGTTFHEHVEPVCVV